MPTQDSVVSIPFVGGLNQQLDPDQLQPPELTVAENVVVRRGGRLEKRNGLQMVTPSAVFNGSSTLLPTVIEAIGSNDGRDGTSVILAGENKLYEFVGEDSAHGWRQINDLPRFLGTTMPTSSTGGSVIETESLLFDNETKRITVWVTGKRTGDELSSDRMVLDQVNGDGNSVYYSVQWVNSHSFLVPPTRVVDVAGNAIQSAINLRLTKLSYNPATGSAEWPFFCWYDKNTDQIYGVLIEPDQGTQKPLAALPKTVSAVKSHRNFDLTGVANSLGLYGAIMYVVGEQDTDNAVTAAKLELRVAQVNSATGAITSVFSQADIMPHVNPISSDGFVAWANRGVMLEQMPEITVPSAHVLMRITASIAVRVIARYADKTDGVVTLTDKIDGQLAVSSIVINVSNALAYTRTAYVWKYVPCIGFQTMDDTKTVCGLNTSPRRYSGGPKQTAPYYTATNDTINLPVAGPVAASGAFQPTSEWAITVALQDSSRQTYFCDVALKSGLWTMQAKSCLPYDGVVTSGIDLNDPLSPSSQNGSLGLVRGNYPRAEHSYRNDANLPWSYVPDPTKQVNLVVLQPAGAKNTGFTPGTYPNVALQTAAGVEICRVSVHVALNGSVDAISIVDCATGPGPGYAFAGLLPWSLNNVKLDTAVVGMGTLNDAVAYNLAAPGTGAGITGQDIPDRTAEVGTKFWYKGGMEHCVHRWSTLHSGTKHLFALSSTSANRDTNPQGDAPFGAASALKYNNFFEFYQAEPVVSTGNADTEYTALVKYSGGTSVGVLSCALGGPWRLVGGLVQKNGNTYCAVTPSGDDLQASTYLLRLPVDTISISTPNGHPAAEEPYPSPDSVFYLNNRGVFVECANMMRTTAPCLNLPTIWSTSTGLIVGGLKNGSSKGTQACMSIEYDQNASNWRVMRKLADYTFINGGLLSVFDGVNCNEHGSLLWPQRDLTSIWYADGGAQPLWLSLNAYAFEQASIKSANWTISLYPLSSITRPFFFYEAGLRGLTSGKSSFGVPYTEISTKWGGDPTKDYQSIYQDLRTQNFSSYTTAGYAGGHSAFGPHYYGRYQLTPLDFETKTGKPLLISSGTGTSLSYFVWAPRSGVGLTYDPAAYFIGKECTYSQEESGGNFLMSFCYEYADGTGRIVKSAPSAPIQYTVCAAIKSSSIGNKDSNTERSGGTVSVFKYGFFAPGLELTNRLQSASVDPRRVVLQPYTTAEPYSSVMYRMPWGNFLNSVNDFVVPRNASRGVVPHASVPWDGSSVYDMPCGLVITNVGQEGSPGQNNGYHGCFDGVSGDYNGILREPFLYTTGGVLDNVAPPGCKTMCVHQNRLVIGGADDPTVIWISKELSPTDAPGFNDSLTLTIEDGGPVTGLASLNGNLIVFKKANIFVVPGVLPDATGNAQSMGEPIKLPAGVGCIDHRSLVETPVGVFFLSERGLEVLYPTLQVEQIGQKVKETLAAYPTIVSAIHNPDDQEARFLAKGSAGGIVVCYSYQFNVWSTHKSYAFGANSASIAQMALVDGRPWVASNQNDGTVTTIYKQSDDSGLDVIPDFFGVASPAYVKMKVYTAPIDMNQVQGYQRVKRARLLCTQNVMPGQVPDNLPAVSMKAQTDYNATYYQTSSWTTTQLASVLSTQGRAQVEVHVAEQKGQKITVGFEEGDPASTPDVADKCWGLALSNVSLVVGLKRGLDKRILPEAKH